jgi:hypothetical protein
MTESRGVAGLRKKVARLEEMVDDQRRSIAALHKQLGEMRALLPNTYPGPAINHPAVRQVRRTT